MIYLAPCRIEDFDDLELREYERLNGGAGLREKLNILFQKGTGWTLRCENKVLGIGGYFELWKGVYEMWIFPSTYVSDYNLIFSRAVKMMLRSIEENCPVHRLQTECLADSIHDRWMQFLGFECEGVLRKYSSEGLDFKQWSKVYGG